jgi:hypothetical protein
MANVRAKVTCSSLELFGNDNTAFKFSAVMSGGDENKSWSKWTPSLSLTMQVTNPEVKFEPGKEYYLDFTPAS